MQFIKITDPGVVLESEPYNQAKLLQGQTYLLSKAHARSIADLGLGELVEGADRLFSFQRSDLRVHESPLKVLFLFNGGYGDAMALALLFNGLKQVYNIQPGIACDYTICKDILRPMGFSGLWHQLPVECSIIDAYDRLQARADSFFMFKNEKWNLCIVEELGKAYRIDLEKIPQNYSISDEVSRNNILPESSRIRVGLNFESKGGIRSYPRELQSVIINLLQKAGFEVFLFGKDASRREAVQDPDLIHDYRGKTTVPDLATLIKQMDAVISVDSFIAHLSNLMGVRTIVLLSTTRKGIYNHYDHIRCLESKIACSPCGEVADVCPKGFDRCAAFFHESIEPEIVVYSLIKDLAHGLNGTIQAANSRIL